MALPPQALEKLVKESSATQGAYKELLFLSGGLLLIMLMLYAGLKFGYKSYLNNAIINLDQEIKTTGESIPLEKQKTTANLYSQLVNLRQLLSAHTIVSPVFSVLERSADPNVYYVKLNVNTATNEANLSGAAKSLGDAARVAALIAKTEGVERINFQNAGSQGGLWQFTMSVFMKPATFHANGAPSPVLTNTPPPPLATSTPSSAATTTGTSTTP